MAHCVQGIIKKGGREIYLLICFDGNIFSFNFYHYDKLNENNNQFDLIFMEYLLPNQFWWIYFIDRLLVFRFLEKLNSINDVPYLKPMLVSSHTWVHMYYIENLDVGVIGHVENFTLYHQQSTKSCFSMNIQAA